MLRPHALSLVSLLVLPLVACGGKGAPAPTSTSTTSAGAGAGPATTSGTSTGGTSSTTTTASATTTATATPDSPPESIDGALPTNIDKTATFSRKAECPEKDKGGCPPMKGVVPLPDSIASQVDGSLPFFAWEMVLPRKSAMALTKHVGVDLYVFLLDGEVSILADDFPGKQKRLWKWNAARIPGIGVTVFAKEPTRALMVYVTNTPGATMAQAQTVGGKVAWAKRPAEAKTVELDKQTDLSWGDGAYHVRLGFEDGSASLESLFCSKNAPVKEHTHDKEWEILAVLSGDGTLVRKPGGKEEDVKIAPGTFAWNPPGVAHAYKPAGTSPLLAVQIYLPPGPEQRFKKLAADAKK